MERNRNKPWPNRQFGVAMEDLLCLEFEDVIDEVGLFLRTPDRFRDAGGCATDLGDMLARVEMILALCDATCQQRARSR